jgi:PTH1 family peptidyl-tRNA hydrolase
MLLFVGLGNPGARYAGNRHNIGFMAAEAIAKRHDFGSFRRKFAGVAAEGNIADTRVTLLMPGTFMNESGRAVAEAVRLYQIAPSDIVVFHDELELPPGKLRVKTGGGNAGHNGLRSISGLISNDYKRVRLGIGHPGQKHLVESYVLQDFQKSEWPWVETLCDVVADNVTLLAEGKDSTFQNKVHLAMTAKGFGDPEPSGSK